MINIFHKTYLSHCKIRPAEKQSNVAFLSPHIVLESHVALLDVIRSFQFYSTVTNKQRETSQEQFHGKGQRKVISKRKQNTFKNTTTSRYGNLLGILNKERLCFKQRSWVCFL